MNPPTQSLVPVSLSPNATGENPVSGFDLLAVAVRKMMKEPDAARVYRAVCEESCRLLGADRSMIFRLRRGEPVSREILHSHRLPAEYLEAVERKLGASDLSKSVIHSGRLAVVGESDFENRIVLTREARAAGHKTICFIPLVVEGEPFAILALYHLVPCEYGGEDRRLAAALGEFASLAIEKSRWAEALASRMEGRERLHRALRRIFSSPGENEILQAVLAESEHVMGTDRCCVVLADERKGTPRVCASQGISSEFVERIAALPEPFPIVQAYFRNSGKEGPTIIPDVDADPDLGPAHHAEGHRMLAAFPLRAKGRNIGLLFFFWVFPREMDEELRSMGEAFAGGVAAAVEYAGIRGEADKDREVFRSAVDDHADAMVVAGPDRKIMGWNRQAEVLYGYSEAEARGKDVLDLLSPSGRGPILEEFREKLSDSIREGTEFTGDLEFRRKDAKPVSVEMTVSPVKNPDGEVVAICLVFRDLSERGRSKENLNRAVAEEIHTKSEFLSHLSHGLRSPLNSVIGFSELLLMKSKEEEALRLLPKIRDAGKYLSRVVDDLMDVDRIESGTLKLEVSEVSLNILVGKLVETWKASLPEGFSVEYECVPDYRSIACDPVRITQIVNNLLDNAVKYSPRGGRIRVKTQAKKSEAWISVSDEGIGIDPGRSKVVFDRFRQLNEIDTKFPRGLGIGLYLVRQLVALHGGRIWLDSEEGKGSVFTFALPYQTSVPNGAVSGESPAGDGPEARREPWAGRTVLLVDDIEMFHQYINMLMKSASQIISAYNGMEGVTMARREKPDFILMDLRMPVMNGFAAIEKIKADPETKDIPILAVTAQVMDEDRERCERLGVNEFVAKPVDLANLIDQVKRVLSKNP